jgi:predicted PurR-regulated permease PerM
MSRARVKDRTVDVIFLVLCAVTAVLTAIFMLLNHILLPVIAGGVVAIIFAGSAIVRMKR